MSANYLSIGLTGSIGMGKSTTAKIFVKHGSVLWDADLAVDEIYKEDLAFFEKIKAALPNVIHNGKIDRDKIKELISVDPDYLAVISKILAPRLRVSRDLFRKRHQHQSFLIFDVPLLFENKIDHEMDFTVVVSTSYEIQRKRVLSRRGMSIELFELLLSRQLDDKEKRIRADFIVDSSSLASAQQDVDNLMKVFELELKKRCEKSY